MDTKSIKSSKVNGVTVRAVSGHFATNHSHIGCYVDLSDVKFRHKMAREAAAFLAGGYDAVEVDTIICQEGTEMIGAFMADSLSRSGIASLNRDRDICVLTPELNTSGQLMFRENTLQMVSGKNIVLLLSSLSTGQTADRAINCLGYYAGRLVGVSALFSVVPEINGTRVNTIFTGGDITDYRIYSPDNCELCAAKQPIDAIVNSFGYSKI